MSDDQIRACALKLLALARRGVGGERENAQRFLEKLLSKHGLTLADLDDATETPTPHFFKYRGSTEKRLFVQLVCTVLGKNSFSRRRSGSNYVIEVTRAQAMEIELAFDVHRKALAKHLDRAFIAYIQTNRLTGVHDPDEDAKPGTLSREDVEAIMAMMAAMRPTEVLKRLSAPAAVCA